MKKSIIERLLPVISAKGYSEMSISCISEAIGLKKSSIYHFFPNGKAQIALEIILYVDKILSQSFSELIETQDIPSIKFHRALDVLSDFYKNGQSSCLLDVMTIANNDKKIAEALKTLLYKLINFFNLLLLGCDFNEKKAHDKAIEIVTLIQGALILSRVTHENSFFLNQIQSLKTHTLRSNAID